MKNNNANHNAAYWRRLRNHMQTSACYVNVYSKEHKNLCKRIRWINENRL